VAGVHICRGNYGGRCSPKAATTPSRSRSSRCGRRRVPASNTTLRAGDFRPAPLRPDRTRVILGLVSSKKADVESAEGLKRRSRRPRACSRSISSASRRNVASASAAGGNPLTPEGQQAKLRLIVGLWRPTSVDTSRDPRGRALARRQRGAEPGRPGRRAPVGAGPRRSASGLSLDP